MNKFLFIDFEYNSSENRDMGLVSVAMCDEKHTIVEGWLANHQDTVRTRAILETMKGEVIVCFNADAEARCFVALGLNPLDYKWIDLYLDYKQLQNNDIRHQFGKYVDKNVWGKYSVQRSIGLKNRSIGEYVKAKEYERQQAIHKARVEKEGCTVQVVTANLLNATLNFTDTSDADIIQGAVQKAEVRDLIIQRKSRNFNEWERNQILEYGRSDIADLQTIMHRMGIALENATGRTPDEVLEGRLFRGRVGAMMAIVASNGTPICRKSLNNLTKNALAIENTAKAELNIRTGLPLCQWSLAGKLKKQVKFDKFTKKYDSMEEFINSIPEMANTWPMTKSKKVKQEDGTVKVTPAKYSLASDIIESYKSNPVIGEYRKMLKTCNAMKYSKAGHDGVSEVGRALGADNRLRCTLFPYGTQTGRNAARAKQYIYAQGAWIKAALIYIPEGYKLAETDYSSQEFLIGGVLAGDKAMIEAYKTDVYISFGVAANQYPDYCNGLTVAEIKKLGHTDQVVADVRQRLKAVVLGLSYGAGAETISANTGIHLRDVESLITKYKKTYSKYYQWREKVWNIHCKKSTKPLIMKHSSWYLGKDNDNKLSTQNFPVQATGATLLHVALDRVLQAGVHIINTLHDAIYYLVPSDDNTTVPMVEKIMLKASEDVLGDDSMKIESEIWNHGERVITPKGAKDWNNYKKYVENSG